MCRCFHADTEDGIYINAGFAWPNMATGELSATVDSGFRIKDGEIVHPVKNTMFGAHFIDLMKSVDAVSSDYREEPGRIMPTIRVRGVKVAGGA